MRSSCYETQIFHFQRLQLRPVSRTKVTLPDTSGQLLAFLPASLVMDSGLGPMSFLIAPPRLKAKNSARTYRLRPLHPRHIVPSLRSFITMGRIKQQTVGRPIEQCPAGEAAVPLALHAPNGARTQKLLGLRL